MALIDARCNWPSIAAVPGCVAERDTLPAFGVEDAAWTSLRLAILDGDFTTERCGAWFNLHGMHHEVVTRAANQKGIFRDGAAQGRRAQSSAGSRIRAVYCENA